MVVFGILCNKCFSVGFEFIWMLEFDFELISLLALFIIWVNMYISDCYRRYWNIRNGNGMWI